MEIRRVLVDVQQAPWDQAWELTKKSLHYTNHAVMLEALEKWPVERTGRRLPHHAQLIGEINLRWCQELSQRYVTAPWSPT